MQKFSTYLAFVLTGIAIGVIAATLKITEYWCIRAKVGYSTEITDSANEDRIGLGWFYFVIVATIFALIAGIMCVYLAPASQGSGIPEMMGTMNGVSLPELFTFDTLLAKVLGLASAQVAGLCVGQEGPMAHVGASTA